MQFLIFWEKKGQYKNLPRQAKNQTFSLWAEKPSKKKLLQIEFSKGNRHAIFDFSGKRNEIIGIYLGRPKIQNFRLGPKNLQKGNF